jgi:hypothetical protein
MLVEGIENQVCMHAESVSGISFFRLVGLKFNPKPKPNNTFYLPTLNALQTNTNKNKHTQANKIQKRRSARLETSPVFKAKSKYCARILRLF